MHDVPEPTSPAAVLEHLRPGADLIVPLANGEPVALLDAIEAPRRRPRRRVACTRCTPCTTARTSTGRSASSLRHVSYFLSHVTRPRFRAGTIDLVPNNFSEMRDILTERTRDPLVLAAASPPDRHGYFSLGLNADYVASFIGRARFFLEANAAHAAHVRPQPDPRSARCVGWVEADYPLVEVPPAAVAASWTERIAGVRRRADPQRGHDPDRHRLDPQRHPVGPATTTATSASTPS